MDFYAPLPETKTHPRVAFTSQSPYTTILIQQTLTSHPTHPRPAAIYSERVKGKHVLLDDAPNRDAQLLKLIEERKAHRERKVARKKQNFDWDGRRAMRLRGIWDLDELQAKYELFLPLHSLWLGYIAELLNLPSRPPDFNPTTLPPRLMQNHTALQSKLVKADFHGAIITVKDSKNHVLKGISGMVILESEGTFKVITREDQFKAIPKKNSIFTFRIPVFAPPESPETTQPSVPELEFDLYGNQFCFSPADRSNKKFKAKETLELK